MQCAQDKLNSKLLKYTPFYTQIHTLESIAQKRQEKNRQPNGVRLSISTFNRIKFWNLLLVKSLIFQYFRIHHPELLRDYIIQRLKQYLNQMEQLGLIEWKNDQNFTVNLVSPFELADAIYAWAKVKKLIGYTEPLKGITKGSQNDQTKQFYNLPQEQILKACIILEETGRCQGYEFDGLYSINLYLITK